METMANNNVMNNELNATKRTDIYQIDPRNIVVVEGFNARKNFDLDELKENILNNETAAKKCAVMLKALREYSKAV